MESPSQPVFDLTSLPLTLDLTSEAARVDAQSCRQAESQNSNDDDVKDEEDDKEEEEGEGQESPNIGSTTLQSIIEPDDSIDDQGYASSITASYVTSIASAVRRGIEENGRIYAGYGIHKPWVPVDDMEVRMCACCLFEVVGAKALTNNRCTATTCNTINSLFFCKTNSSSLPWEKIRKIFSTWAQGPAFGPWTLLMPTLRQK
jgi:hypothetical protein